MTGGALYFIHLYLCPYSRESRNYLLRYVLLSVYVVNVLPPIEAGDFLQNQVK